MNKIFKVIYSKVRNCYVVTSEFAKANTKSSTGSAKSKTGKKALLTLAVASAIMCGGFVNVGAADTVHVDESTSTTYQEVYTKDGADKAFATKDALATKAYATTVTANTTNIENNKNKIQSLQADKLDKTVAEATYAKSSEVYTKTEVNDALTAAGTNVDIKLADYAKTADVNAKLAKKADTDSVYSKTEANNTFTTKDELNTAKTELEGKITTAKNELDGKIANNTTNITSNKAAIDDLKTKVGDATGGLTKTVNDLTGKVDTVESDITDLKDKDVALEGKINANSNDITGLKDKDVELEGKINTAKTELTNVDTALDAKITANKDKIQQNTNNIASNKTAIDNLKNNVGTVTDGGYLEGSDTIAGNLGRLNTGLTDEVAARTAADNALSDRIDKTDKRTAGITRTDTGVEEDNQTVIEGKVHFDQDGNISDVKDLTTTGDAKIGGDLTVDGTIHADKITFGNDINNSTTIDKGTISSKNDKVQSDGTHKSSSMEFDESKFEVGVSDKDSNSHFKMDADKTQLTNSDLSGKNFSDIAVDKDKIKTTVKDENGNISSVKESASEINHWVQDKDGNWSTNHQDATSATTTVSNKDGSQSTQVEQTTTDITNTAKEGTIRNDAKDIENIASGNIKNSSATMDTTVTGEAKESYGKLTTSVEGDESHTVKGSQSTTVEGNVSEDYKQDLTTKIGGNEIHEVTGTKTETVTGKVSENFKGGQETNVTGDQTTKVSGTQTTNATDIKRNASSSMVDSVFNAYGTNTETKEAGKTTTDMTIAGTGEKGQYIRGANESRDYLINGTLKNSETKTAEATSTEITDGTNTSATIQDKANLAGSVTKGTETGVSGIHGNADGTVSIDSVVTDDTSTSTINQKKDSITSAVGEGGNSTVIRQDKDNVTIASSNGTVAIAGKDIINNATGNMTNTVGGNLTTTVTGKTTEDYRGGLDTTVTGNEKHTVKGNQTNEVDGDQTNTIKGNQTTTVTGDISNSAANITNKATGTLTDKVGENTRVLDKDGITDTVGNTSFKQRVDDILMEAKNGTITNDAKNLVNKAAETITNEAVDITNNATGTISSNASEIKNKAGKLISNKVGENTYQNIEDGKITESIKNGTKQNLTQSDADGTNHSVVNGNKSSVTKQTSEEITGAVTDGTSTNVTQNTATSSNNTIASNGKANSVISTVNGTEFVNSDAAAPVTGASGAGTADRTTIKGNTITTGKVTMDYAEVMKDLGVRGNANITGKTTTGSLEVTGTSTLKGDVTMERNATVKENLTVEGTTTTKTLKVTDNATVGGTLDVAKKATFGDSVDIAKDLNVTGDVTAKSYKVGNNTYIDANGINANNQKITNVAPGELSENSTDAVNGSQLFATNRRIEQFDSRINEVGANAAAMANLHPMEFDADSKLNVAVGVGNYRNKTATAMGLFYRPNEDVMFNVSSTIGSNDNMVGGGISFRLGSGGNKEKTKALAQAAEQNKQLKSQVDTLQAQMDALLSVINPNMSKDFPDVPNNHWAYEAVSRLAGNDIIQGYEDGKYHGERTMTRYEMAVIIYKALQKGAKAEAKLVEEFKPELKAIAAHEKA